MRLRCFFAALCLAAPGLTAPVAARPLAVPVELLQPADGAILRGGDTVTLRWQPTPALAQHRAEEWEAFLSLDGGRTFSRRITPHLDIALRSVSWQVPNTASADARLLLRLGDERSEIEALLPARFRIAARPEAPWSWQPLRLGAGEAPRPGAPGVVAWVEGDRQGRGGRAVEAAPAPYTCGDGNAPQLRRVGTSAVCDGPAPPPLLVPPAETIARLDDGSRRASARPGVPLRARDILGLIQRQNE